MKKIIGTKQTERPRISVFRSNNYIYAQIIDDVKGITLTSASEHMLDAKKAPAKKATESVRLARARAVGVKLAERAKAAKITKVWFDRGNYKYHGRVRALAEGARSGGLEF